MSFDWMSFATGFLERTEEIQETRREEAQTFEREQRAAAQRNAATISRRRAIADQVTGYANYLQSNGVSNEQLQAVIASGPQAIEQLTSRVQSAVQANGGRPLGSSDVASIISMPEGFTPVDMTTQEFIDQTYGLAVTPTSTEEREFSLLDRIGGRDQMARAEGRLRQTPFMEGMTIEQINQAAMQGDYQSLIPGTFASIVGSTGTPYDFDASTDFTVTFERRLATLQDSSRWAETLGMPMEEREAAQAALLEEAMGPIIRMGVNTYGDAFLVDQESYLRSIMGDTFMDTFIDEETSPETTDEPTPSETTDEPAGSPPEAMTEAPQAMTAPVVDTEEGTEASTTEEQRIDREAPTLEEPTVETPASDTVVEGTDGVEYTYEDWQGMSRSQREAAGLPVSVIGGEIRFRRFQAGLGMPSLPTMAVSPGSRGRRDTRPEIVDDSQTNAVGSRGRGARRDANAAERALLEQGVDAQSIQVLNSSGADMQSYVMEQGATTPLEIATAVEEFAAQEGITLPEDLSVIVYALQSSMPQQ